jgi:hypothetical protein
MENCIGWKHEIRSHEVCEQSLKTIFEFLKNHHWNIIYQKNCLIFQTSFHTFKVATTKFSWEFTMFQETFYMFKALKKSMWTCGFLFQKSFFLIKCSPNHFNFFVNFNIFYKKGSMCSKHSKSKNTYTLSLDFDTQTSLRTIIVLNLQSSKITDLTIM